jgi:hypothetical protein
MATTSGPRRRRPPLSIRLSEKERADLEARAGDQPLSAFIKDRLFRPSAGGRGNAVDRPLIARVLAHLGSSDIARNLARLADAAEAGALPVDQVTRSQLEDACRDIRLMRLALMWMLRKQAGAEPAGEKVSNLIDQFEAAAKVTR